ACARNAGADRNQRWSLDFQSDALADGRRFRIFATVDDFTRERFTPLSEPDGAPTYGFVGRLLDDKGIRTLVVTHRLLRKRIPESRLLIAGASGQGRTP